VTGAALLAVLALLVLMGLGGNVWLLAQEARGRARTGRWNTRILRWLSFACTVVVLGTAVFARPWYWDLVLVAVAVAALAGTQQLLHLLSGAEAPSPRRALLLASGAMGLGLVLLAQAGVAAVLDGAALSSGDPVVAYHGGELLQSPVVYQLFWGTDWTRPGVPAVSAAIDFDAGLERSAWARSVVASGFGVQRFTAGGCWVDPSDPRPGTRLDSASALVRHELTAVLGGEHQLLACSASGARRPPATLPADAIVALWLPAQTTLEISGVAAHGAVTLPGQSGRVELILLPGGYAAWSLPSCGHDPACEALPSYAAPSYTLSHEVLEAATNPRGGGWFAAAPLSWTARYVLSNGPATLVGVGAHPSYPGELADLCEPGSVVPGQPLLQGLLDQTDPLPVAAFFRPGKGCVT
jgi:hypothetical protein